MRLAWGGVGGVQCGGVRSGVAGVWGGRCGVATAWRVVGVDVVSVGGAGGLGGGVVYLRVMVGGNTQKCGAVVSRDVCVKMAGVAANPGCGELVRRSWDGRRH